MKIGTWPYYYLFLVKFNGSGNSYWLSTLHYNDLQEMNVIYETIARLTIYLK